MSEYSSTFKPINIDGCWTFPKGVEVNFDNVTSPPRGSIEKLIGRKLTWEDEPVEIKENNEN